MIQRKTQTGEYWRNFSLTPSDIEFVHGRLLDSEQPVATREISEALIAERCRREDGDLRAELARGAIYQPKKHFAVGDKIIFPALDFRLGQIVDLRPGQNPEYGEFSVITVDFGADRRQRSFAADLKAPHKLNLDIPDLLATGEVAPPAKLLTTIASHVPGLVKKQLAAQPAFACVEDRWLLRDLLAEVHIGHLNIAEALIEMRGAPVDTATLRAELDLPAEINPAILSFSLQSALTADGRFDQVGPGDTHRWFLRRLEPPEALAMPQALQYEPIPYDPFALPKDLRDLEMELSDEWSEDLVEPSPTRSAPLSATLLLTYPHLVSGTLPINRRARAFFPAGQGERTMMTLVDGRWGQRFPAWAVHSGRYVAGLRAWFEQHKLPAGAYITLEHRDSSGEVVVDFRPKRMRREWTRRALAPDHNQLDIQLRKQEIACEYDEQAIISDEKPEDIQRLRNSPAYAQKPLPELVYEIIVDLAGLSQSGAVHAKTVYSAFNVLRRCPPGPILAALASDSRLEGAGEGLFRLKI